MAKIEMLSSDGDDETLLTVVLHEEDHTIGCALTEILGSMWV